MNIYKQIEIMPLPHGGKRNGAGRKKIETGLKKPETMTVRIDKRLLEIVEMLKKEMATENHEKITAIKDTLNGISPTKSATSKKQTKKGNATITTVFESTSSGECYQKWHDEKLEGQNAVIQSGENWKIIKIEEF